MHQYTHALALLLIAADKGEDYEYIADSIEVTLLGYPDEHKADLYSLLAESVYPGMSFTHLKAACDKALRLSAARFLRG